jgi:hypothetical protein
MKQRRLSLCVACLTLVLFIAVLAPAKLLAVALQQHYPDVRISSVSGTLWRGRAYGVAADLHGHGMSLSNLSWRLHPMSLLILSPRVDLEGELGRQTYSARLTRQLGGRWLVEDLKAILPAQLLSHSIGLPLSGEISAEVAELAISNNGITELEGRIVLQQAAINEGASWSQLGSFAAELAPNADGGLVVTVFDLGGAVELNTTVFVEMDGSYRMDGVVAVRDAGNSVLQHWLPMVGEEIAAQSDDAGRNGARRYRIAPQGSFW